MRVKVRFTEPYNVRYQHRTFSFATGDEVAGQLARYLVDVGAPVEVVDEPSVTFDDLPKAAELRAAGYDTLNAVRAATDADLRAVEGVGRATVADIRQLLA